MIHNMYLAGWLMLLAHLSWRQTGQIPKEPAWDSMSLQQWRDDTGLQLFSRHTGREFPVYGVLVEALSATVNAVELCSGHGTPAVQ